MGGMGGGPGGAGCVLLISNLNETETEPDHLFTLFGVYGDVQVNTYVAKIQANFLNSKQKEKELLNRGKKGKWKEKVGNIIKPPNSARANIFW